MSYLAGAIALAPGPAMPRYPMTTVKPVTVTPPRILAPIKPLLFPVLRFPTSTPAPVLKVPVGPQTSSGYGTPLAPTPTPSMTFSSTGSPVVRTVTVPSSAISDTAEKESFVDTITKNPLLLVAILAGVFILSRKERRK